MRNWYSSYMHKSLQADVSSRARGLNVCLSLHRHQYFVYAAAKAPVSLRICKCADLPEPSLLNNEPSNTSYPYFISLFQKLRTPYDIALAKGLFELAETLDGHLTAEEARKFYLNRIGAIYGVSLICFYKKT